MATSRLHLVYATIGFLIIFVAMGYERIFTVDFNLGIDMAIVAISLVVESNWIIEHLTMVDVVCYSKVDCSS